MTVRALIASAAALALGCSEPPSPGGSLPQSPAPSGGAGAVRAGDASPSVAEPPSPFDAAAAMSQEQRVERVRRQFERPHGGDGHVALGCPACADPMSGVLPEEALLRGPADVWN